MLTEKLHNGPTYTFDAAMPLPIAYERDACHRPIARPTLTCEFSQISSASTCAQ
jgi:hypothetical protein